MDFWHLVLLALIQGLTEFLPVSSSAHLILPAKVMGWPDQGPLIDLMAHLGSLGAVMLYFRRDVGDIVVGALGRINLAKPDAAQRQLALNIAVATPPVLIAGFAMNAVGLDEAVRSPLIIALTMAGFGIVLWLADIWGKSEKTADQMTIKTAAFLGLSQVLALIPGTSRSGITMTAARALGFTRPEAARFSMLMAIPVILAGGLYALFRLVTNGENAASLSDGLWVVGLSFIAAYAAIAVFMKLIAKISFLPFMIYRVALGAILLFWIVSGGAA
ncbi:undecaprenyl-diphosphate phosphatase [Robiginitomaculum antarcticum]|uniref:undecaprenyl-diphosphate phosphatase n=1 Tax=Robiginitomaculum antarcticum TaxID=437507 RepID=UPI00037F33D4|nr:undecaprenyl-diphosphate phosphatase [Robiginitomaculum antarcticum]